MQSVNVVLLQSDAGIARSLVSALSTTVRSIHQVNSLGELRASIAKHRAGVAVLDIEQAPLSEVERLSHDFPGASLVCTHRCADEEMWAEALRAGAADVCPSTDTGSIVRSVLSVSHGAKSAAA
jgi:DNA-binding NtrC family response regulator